MQGPVQAFKYPGLDVTTAREALAPAMACPTILFNNDTTISTVQVFRKGEGNKLHSHADQDGYWFVINDRLKVHGEGDSILAELGTREGVFIPHGNYYWLEADSEERLELLRVSRLVPAEAQIVVFRCRTSLTVTVHDSASSGVFLLSALSGGTPPPHRAPAGTGSHRRNWAMERSLLEPPV